MWVRSMSKVNVVAAFILLAGLYLSTEHTLIVIMGNATFAGKDIPSSGTRTMMIIEYHNHRIP